MADAHSSFLAGSANGDSSIMNGMSIVPTVAPEGSGNMYDAEYEWPEDRVPRSSTVGRMAYQVQTTALRNQRNQAITAGMVVGFIVLLFVAWPSDDPTPPPPPPPPHQSNQGKAPEPEPEHQSNQGKAPEPEPEPQKNVCNDMQGTSYHNGSVCSGHGRCQQEAGGSKYFCKCENAWSGEWCETCHSTTWFNCELPVGPSPEPAGNGQAEGIMTTMPPSTGTIHIGNSPKTFAFAAQGDSIYQITVTDLDGMDSITSVLDCTGNPIPCQTVGTDTCESGHVESDDATVDGRRGGYIHWTCPASCPAGQSYQVKIEDGVEGLEGGGDVRLQIRGCGSMGCEGAH